jgi:protein involved in polysaccharide export with SLBB domain
MQAGQAGFSWWRCWYLSGLVLLAGCAMNQARLTRSLLLNRNPSVLRNDLDRHYQVHCPDVLEVAVEGVTSGASLVPVTPDGRIALVGDNSLRVGGFTTPEIARLLARHHGVDADQVQVRVAQYNSQQLFLYGQVSGGEHAIAYQGPETVLDVLQRAGGLSTGASVDNVQVIRSHVADGKPPEVFHVDLVAIVRYQDQQTNIPVEPCDQIYVGQTRRSKICPCLPPWLRPLYETASGMKRR